MRILLIFLISYNATATTISSSHIIPKKESEYSTIIINSLWQQAGHKNSQKLKPITAKQLTKSEGQLYIEKQKKINRKRLKLRKFTNLLSPRSSLLRLRNQGLNKLIEKKQKTLNNWKTSVNKTYAKWATARVNFLNNLSDYKKATVTFELEASFTSTRRKELELPFTKAAPTEFHIIPKSLDLEIRDQGKRATCAAFSGIRAIETILNAKDINLDLSEQYFYWASKPKCQKSPCKNKGSWITSGYRSSQNSSSMDIPLSENCPYIPKNVTANETQIPLARGCTKGHVQIKDFNKMYSINDLYDSLTGNSPVIAGFKLSANFYKSKGLVTYKDSFKRGSTDLHAAGHAMLIVGYMTLPTPLHKTEGKLCFIVANSWGQGWGRGGFGCLTEAWIKKYKVDNAFVALNSVRIGE